MTRALLRNLLLAVSFGVTAIPHTVADVQSIATTVDGSFTGVRVSAMPTVPPSPEPYANKTPEPSTTGNLTCYGKCYGIRRSNAIDAINWYCNRFSGTTFHSIDDMRIGTWNYPADTKDSQAFGWKEEGHIKLITSVREGGTCDPAMIMTFEACSLNFRSPIDDCDTQGENGKHGGFIYNGCLKHDMQTNPDYWPDCLDHFTKRAVDMPSTFVTRVAEASWG